ncbi:MAG: MbcA/ParS/Xre antitoxin family protein [Steroidobacteraceae bacterium]
MSLPAAATDSSTVLSKATVRASRELGLRQSDLARILGLSTATASRLDSGAWRLSSGSKAWELAAAFTRLYRSLSAITGGKSEAMRTWLHSENDALSAIPARRILTAEGLFSVLSYLDAARGQL